MLIGIEGVITFYGSGFSIEEATVALSSCVLNSSMSYVMVTPITVHFLRSNWGRNSPVVNFFNADEFENNVFMHLADDEGVTRIFEELIVVASSCFFDWGRNSPVVNFFNADEFENNVLMHLADDEGVTRIFEELIVVVSSCFFEALSDKCVGSVRPPPLPHLPTSQAGSFLPPVIAMQVHREVLLVFSFVVAPVAVTGRDLLSTCSY